MGGIGGIASGIAGLFGGDPTKSEETGLQNLSGFETPQGENLTGAAGDYYSNILSGNPEAISQTLAPEISQQANAANQKALQLGEFGNRSGGTNAAEQQATDTARGNIANLIGGLQSGAASGAGTMGGNLLSQASTNEQAQAELAQQAQKSMLGDIGGIAGGVGDVISDNPGGIFDKLQ